MLSRYNHLPEFDEILIYGGGQATEQQGPIGEPPAKLQQTSREYIRRNIPGGSQQGQESAMMQILTGGNPQGAERAALGRPVG